MNIVKHSQRTNRRPCRACGSSTLYWGHDLDRGGNKPCEDSKCPGHGRRVSWVLLDADGITVHAETCSGRSNGPVVAPPEPGTDDHDDIVCMAPSPAAVADAMADVVASDYQGLTGPSHGTQDPGAVLADMVRPYLGGVDAEAIDKLVAEAWAARALPVTINVTRDGVTTTLPGTHHVCLPNVLTNLVAGEHTMMVGPAGTGKSTLAHQAAEAMGVPYYSISLSPQTPASALLGYMDATGTYVSSLFHKWYTEGGVFHFDEMDNGHPSILATINAALANGVMAFPDGMAARHPDAIACGSANTYGRGADRKYVGRSPLDVATLDRFTVEDIHYDEALEDVLCASTGCDTWPAVVKVVRALRASADTNAMPIVFSPRASVGICRLLKAGRTWSDCVNVRLRRGLSDTDWSKVTDGVKVSI